MVRTWQCIEFLLRKRSFFATRLVTKKEAAKRLMRSSKCWKFSRASRWAMRNSKDVIYRQYAGTVDRAVERIDNRRQKVNADLIGGGLLLSNF